VEVFDIVRPSDLAARAAAGILKQRESSELDRQVIDQALRKLGLPPSTPVLHPSLMFRWFAPFWSGQETLGFVERHARFALMVAPKADVPVTLPREYAAVKFYAARSLPDQPAIRAQLRMLVESLADRLPIVYLDTGLGIDDHTDYVLGGNDRLVSLTGRLNAETNLAVQTQIVAGARLYLGTCGSLAWLAPLLGVPTVPVFTDAAFLHAHLHLARRVYGRVSAGPFSPVDLSGIMNAGLTIGTANDVVVNGRRS